MKITDKRSKAPMTFKDLKPGDGFLFLANMDTEAPRIRTLNGMITFVDNTRKSYYTNYTDMSTDTSLANYPVEVVNLELIITK